jgi:integrase
MALAQRMPERFHALILLTTFGCLRWGEVAALERRDLDAEAGTVRVRQAFIVARAPVWDRVTALGAVRPAPSGHGSVVFLAGGALEIADRWLPGWDTDDLIGEAQIIDALPFAPLSAVRTSKRCTGRAKDLRDLDLIEAHDTPHTRRCCPACRAPTRFATAA